MSKRNMYLMMAVIMAFLGMAGKPIKINADELDEPVIIEQDDPYMFINNASCTLSITSGCASVRSIVNGEYGTIYTGISVYIEKYENGSWHSYASWTHNGGRSQDNTDTTGVGHGTYRAWMTVSATSVTGGCEEFNVDGNTVGY